MSLIEKSTKLGLLFGAALLTGCPGTDTKETGDTDTDTEADPCDADPSLEGCPCDKEAETGLTQFYFVGTFEAPGDVPESGTFGYGLKNVGSGDWGCQMTGSLGIAGDAAAGCPDCSWSFASSGVSGSTGVGDICEDLGLTDGYADESGAYSWGYAAKYYYDYSGTPLEFDKNIMLYIDSDSGWFEFAGNYGSRADWVYGDSTSSQVARPAFDSSGSYVYYYYYTGNYSYDPEGCTYVE